MSQAVISEREAVRKTRGGAGRRALRPLLMLGGIVIVAAGAGWFWLTGGRYVSVDDAYVSAAKLMLSTDVSGIVASVAVKEGQHVEAGQVLLRLDTRQFEIALAAARAELAQTVVSINAMKHDYQRALRETQARQADVASDDATTKRLSALVGGGGVTRQEYDNARFKLQAEQATLEATDAQVQTQLAKLGGNADADPATLPEYRAAQARIDEAQRKLDHTVIRAPFAGVVTMVDQTQPGMYLAASTAAFGLVSDTDVWIDALPKETQLTWVKPGDAADVEVDTYPGHVWHGTVQSIAPASGSEFSVLPAQNSSGNWVKVVQRIPLRIHVDRQPGDPPLRAGMSVEVTIDTRHDRHLLDLF